MVSCYTRSISLIKQQEITKYLIIFAIAMALGITFAFFIARNVRRTLLGYEPTQISQMFLQREEILGTLTEGLLLIGKSGHCEYINPAAQKLFSIEGTNHSDSFQFGSKEHTTPLASSGKQALDDFITRHLLTETNPEEALYRKQIQLCDATLLMDKIPIMEHQHLIGSLILLNDKTETTKMAEELTGVNHIISALRATTHEHKNKLHVILGLLQTGNTSEAIRYINDSASAEEDNSQILSCIENKTIAALILGKQNRARELNISFHLLKGSHLDAHNDYLSATDLVTIIGNLLENAFDSLSGIEEAREVNLYINSSLEGLTIIVDDTGSGMDEQTIKTLLHTSYTSKGDGHGVGLTLIRNIINRCGGILDIESELGEGSSFSVTIHQKRRHYAKGDLKL